MAEIIIDASPPPVADDDNAVTEGSTDIQQSLALNQVHDSVNNKWIRAEGTIGGSLKVETTPAVGSSQDVNVRDGAGTPLTSSLIGSDQALDVNVVSLVGSIPSNLENLVVEFVEDGGGSSDLGVDGSSVPVEFTYDADPTDDLLIQSISFLTTVDEVLIDGSSFLKISSALTNGLLIEVTTGGDTSTLDNWVISEDIFQFAGSGGLFFENGASKDLLISKIFPGGRIKLDGGSSDNIKVTVRDDISDTGIVVMRIKIVGFKDL